MTGGNLNRVGVVVSTIGKSPTLEKLLVSIRNQTLAPEHVVVVDQSNDRTVERLAAEYGATHIRSPRGLSVGRNAGLAVLRNCDIVAFPDDDCEYSADTFQALMNLFEETGADAMSGRLDSGELVRIAFSQQREVLTKSSVWTRTIEPATFYRASSLKAAGSFDVKLGIGAATMWQSGEGTDLLIRLINAGGTVVYDPSLIVREYPADVTPEDYLRKVRSYARGTGRVYKKWYSPKEQLLVVVKPLAAAGLHLVRGRKREAARKLQAALGRLEGMMPESQTR
jgi:glycosyltransferase involved in cell wall biosynthesis